uniref:Uncharacterized protein n=1 Tax=Chromera velia CCMP2878 TaxID=1169474 RepID=A0A0G4HTZ5_9ALVE|eukprot:Cvel_31671.t1-p1 / transcript=Cvel_31671.t1 / gene=Cvel_31671 / organism=Chromera_velia_CCMP2878 / gene_product=hypothetical protein / transcript_product=hypothetical protein / location=Cvel_scaffold4762:2385-2924(+) / protein_length=180 / sequence_SO=supercontig / SO=protein_coding / is_pseudo=false
MQDNVYYADKTTQRGYMNRDISMEECIRLAGEEFRPYFDEATAKLKRESSSASSGSGGGQGPHPGAGVGMNELLPSFVEDFQRQSDSRRSRRAQALREVLGPAGIERVRVGVWRRIVQSRGGANSGEGGLGGGESPGAGDPPHHLRGLINKAIELEQGNFEKGRTNSVDEWSAMSTSALY